LTDDNLNKKPTKAKPVNKKARKKKAGQPPKDGEQ